jgi:hypothetical protein
MDESDVVRWLENEGYSNKRLTRSGGFFIGHTSAHSNE